MKDPRDLNISQKHQRQLESAQKRRSNAFMTKVVAPSFQKFADDNAAGFPHLYLREAGSFAHLDLEEILDTAADENGKIDWNTVQKSSALFTNPLAEAVYSAEKRVPGEHSGYTPPGERIVNARWCVFTFEYDGDTRKDLEMQLDWFAGKPEQAPFSTVHKALSAYPDYRGYCVVFSGNKSLHIHLLFDLQHLSKALAPGQNSAAKKIWSGDLPDSLIGPLYAKYWPILARIITTELGTKISFDPRLGSYIQKRRMPWGVRTFSKPSELHGFDQGDQIEQIVVQESILSRAPNLANKPPLLSADDIDDLLAVSKHAQNKRSCRAIVSEQEDEVLTGLQKYLRAEGWGAFPEPVALTFDGTHNVLNFRNHPEDKHPSTLLRGDHRRLLYAGRHAPPDNLFLPNDLTLDETLDLLFPGNEEFAIADGKARMREKLHPLRRFEKAATSTSAARAKLEPLLTNIATLKGTALVQAPEGLGKTYALMNAAQELRWDEEAERSQAAFEYGEEYIPQYGFTVVACKSYDQAREKAEEFRKMANGPTRVVALISFSKIYASALAMHPKAQEISREEAGANGYPSLIHAIKSQQPEVYASMKTLRDDPWKNSLGDVIFDPDAYVTMVHDVVQYWPHSHYNKAFLHPDFPDDLDPACIEACAKGMKLIRVIYDEVEWQDLVRVEPAWKVKNAQRVAKRRKSSCNKPWDEAPLQERVKAFHSFPAPQGDRELSFDQVDQIIRMRFRKKKDLFTVDTKRFPFGKGTDDYNIYAQANGDKFYCKPKRWYASLACPVIILTTEDLPRKVVQGINTKMLKPSDKKIMTVNLTNLPHLFREIVPVVYDERARMPRRGKVRDPVQDVTDLAKELLEGDVDFVISNGLKHIDDCWSSSVTSHKEARGRNDLKDKAIATVMTYPGVAEYRELCILGAALNIDDPVSLAYRDMLFQDLGRNLGCRSSTVDTPHTVFIKASLLKNLQLFKGEDIMGAGFDRYRLRLVKNSLQ